MTMPDHVRDRQVCTNLKEGKRRGLGIITRLHSKTVALRCVLCGENYLRWRKNFEQAVNNPVAGFWKCCGLALHHDCCPVLPRKDYTALLDARRHILRNCYVRGSMSYDAYGKRGVEVCERWLADPGSFALDILRLRNAGQKGRLTLINPKLPYGPQNVKLVCSADRRNREALEHIATRPRLTRPASLDPASPACQSARPRLTRHSERPIHRHPS